MNKHRAVSACTAQPNTPDTDRMPKVLHRVTVTFEGDPKNYNARLMATDPLDAISRVNRMTTEVVRYIVKEVP